MWSINDYDYPKTEWHQARVTVNFAYTSTNLAITATKLTDDGLIDIDDVKLTSSQCPPPVTCNFNNDWCGFTYNVDYSMISKAYWQLGFGRVIDVKQLSFIDLISDVDPNNIYGKSIYTDFTTNKERKSLKMDVFSDVVHKGTPSTGSCLQFSILPRYFGNGIFEIHITDMKSQIIKTITSLRDIKPLDKWIKTKINVNYNKSFRFLFRMECNSTSTYIAIDDVAYFEKPCAQVGLTTTRSTTKLIPSTAAPSPAFDCDFEKGFCNWLPNNKVSFYNFLIKSSASPNIYVPNFDHTKNNADGKFIYLYTIRGPTPASIYAIDNSMHHKSTYYGPVCLKFWYYILTESWETNFNVTIYQDKNPIKRFYQTDDKGKKWNLGMMQFEMNKENQESEFKVSIDARVRLGAIAFDDIKVSYSYCGTGQHAGECYFEGGQCGVKPSNPFSQPNWKITNGSSLNMVDHTINTVDGSFFAVDFSQQQQNKRNQIELSSYSLGKTTGACVQFWYFMNGLNSDHKLNFVVYVNYQPKTVWHATGNQGSFWYVHRETIIASGQWKIGFVSDGSSIKGIIAIDDITIDTSGPCKRTSGE